MVQLKELEQEMEKFYTTERRGMRLVRQQVYTGRLVAAVSRDLSWHRARVLSSEGTGLLLDFVDWGWQETVNRYYDWIIL